MSTIKKVISGFIICSCFFVGCTDLNDMHQEYLDRGEKIYVGKVDSLKVHGGYYRAEIEGLLHYANTAEKCIIRWGNDSVEISLMNKTIKDTLKVIIGGLEEGTNEFFVQTYDKNGNSSLNESCIGTVYGDRSALTFVPKLISQMTPDQNNNLHLSWTSSEEALFVEFSYETENQGIKSMIIPGVAKETVLNDWKKNGRIEYRTAILPVNAIDTLYTPLIQQEFLAYVEFQLDKATFKDATLATDVKNGYSGRITGLWDGIFGASGNGESQRYHSADGQGVPHHLTFDMGIVSDLTHFEIWGRVGYANWNPKKFQVWGIADLTGAATSLASSDSRWEDEARSKGWILLKECVCADTDFNAFEFDQDIAKNIRYIRYRVIEVWGPPATGSGAYGCLQEITIFGNNIRKVK